jgi:CheY-like chemotaxis protein
VACDYKPPDSAHQISNWWGIYDMFSAYSGHRYPEVAEGAFLPNPQIRSFVHSLRIKKARWLDGERQYRTCDAEAFTTIQDRLRQLYAHAKNKSVVYVDDEGQNGWSDLLQQMLNEDRNSPQCALSEAAEADGDTGSLLAIPDKAGQQSLYATSIERIANWVLSRDPNLVILDLRLRGGLEADQPPNEASGMDVAREIRKRDRYLPILFFTASNKAETLAISQSLDIDDYWMKPGLGEHQGFGTREARLVSLTTQLAGLLGPDYSWLQRAGQQLSILRTSRRKYWWESDVHWASSGCIHRQDRGRSIQRPLPNVKETVIESLEALLYTIRMILRFQLLFAPSRPVSSTSGSAMYSPPAFTSEMLGRSVFNQLGQLVEVVHGLTGDTRVSANGVIGGFFDDRRPKCANGCFLFNRADWWAYRLFALRNKFSHGTTPSIPSAAQPQISLQDLKEAVSDALSWLTCDRTWAKPIDESTVEHIAQQMVAGPRLARGRLAGSFYPLLNLCREAPLSDITINGETVIVAGCSGPLAEDPRFRMQLVSRAEYRFLISKSDRLLGGS